jgi:hypothetical protein
MKESVSKQNGSKAGRRYRKQKVKERQQILFKRLQKKTMQLRFKGRAAYQSLSNKEPKEFIQQLCPDNKTRK